MMNPDYRDAIVQNLKDAGCSAGIIENFLRYFDENQKEKQLELLEIHRNQLLTQIPVSYTHLRKNICPIIWN